MFLETVLLDLPFLSGIINSKKKGPPKWATKEDRESKLGVLPPTPRLYQINVRYPTSKSTISCIFLTFFNYFK